MAVVDNMGATIFENLARSSGRLRTDAVIFNWKGAYISFSLFRSFGEDRREHLLPEAS